MNGPPENYCQERVVKSAFLCRRQLEAYAFALLGDYAEAQDVVQDAFLVVFARWDEFEEGTSMIAWTRAIVRRKALQSMDQRKRRTKIQDRLLNSIESAFDETQRDKEIGNLTENQLILNTCLNQLTQKVRNLLILIYVQNKSYKEAAEETSIAVEAIRKALYRAKKQLRNCMTKHRDEAYGR